MSACSATWADRPSCWHSLPRRRRAKVQQPGMSARTVEPLASEDAGLLRAFLTRDATHNMYALGILEEFGIAPHAGRSFWGRFWGRDLSAVLFVGGEGGLLVPSASD